MLEVLHIRAYICTYVTIYGHMRSTSVQLHYKLLVAKKKKKSYDISFKLKALEITEKSKEATACEFNVNPSKLHEWCSQKDRIVAMVWRRLCSIGFRIYVVGFSEYLAR